MSGDTVLPEWIRELVSAAPAGPAPPAIESPYGPPTDAGDPAALYFEIVEGDASELELVIT